MAFMLKEVSYVDKQISSYMEESIELKRKVNGREAEVRTMRDVYNEEKLEQSGKLAHLNSIYENFVNTEKFLFWTSIIGFKIFRSVTCTTTTQNSSMT